MADPKHFDSDPDPAFHSDSDPEPDPKHYALIGNVVIFFKILQLFSL